MKKQIIILVSLLTCFSIFSYTDTDFKNMLLLNNQEIAKANYTKELADVDVDDAKAGFYPKVEFLATNTYMVKPPIGRITIDANSLIQAGTGITGIGPGPITIYKGMENTLYDFDIKFTQPLFTWGKLTKGVDIYSKVALVREIQKSSLVKQLECKIEGRESAIYYLKDMYSNLKERQELAKQLVTISFDAYQSGAIVEQDYLDAKIKAQEVDMGLSKVIMELDNQLVNLRCEVGLDSLNQDQVEYTPDETIMQNIVNNDWNKMFESATSNLKDSFRMLNLLKDVSVKTKEVADASIYYKPDIALVLDIGYSGPRFPLIETDWYRKDNYRVNATLAVKTTLWDGGKKLNDIKRGEIKIDDSQVDINLAKIKVLNTLNDSLLKIQLDNSNIEYEKLKCEINQNNIDLKQDSLNQGYGDEKDVILAKLEKLDSEFKLIEHKLDRSTNYFIIKFLLTD